MSKALNYLIAIILLIVLMPIMILTALAIKISSGGPVIYHRKKNGEAVIRIGQNGQAFKYFKFRTMDDNGRVTPIGKILRCTHIDETPELFIVLRGDMNLVGPRPYTPEKQEIFPSCRLATKPGITGPGQIFCGHDGNTLNKFRHDIEYIKNKNLWTDIKLISITPLLCILSHKKLERYFKTA
ncbi:MAG: sugar transferase [Patescibacteria group bacterium]|nr:sugar transferase [Patescibacteria group bacterium]